MKTRWLAGSGAVLAVAVGGLWVLAPAARPPGPEVMIGITAPQPPRTTGTAEMPSPQLAAFEPVVSRGGPFPFELPDPPIFGQAEFTVQPLFLPPCEATVAAGDSLDGLLQDVGIPAVMRAGIAKAMGAEFDLGRLRPGHRLSVRKLADGTPVSVTLAVDDGRRILTTLDETPKARTLLPETALAERANSLTVDGSIFASLDRAGIPARFATDLAQMLGGVVDFRRDLKGGETLRLLWREEVSPDGTRVGTPQLTYVALRLAQSSYEVLWPQDAGTGTTLFKDGEILRSLASPVVGGRMTSVFGMRRHPVYGNVRMHKGVDFAASLGTPVRATAPGRVAFIGRRGGYGRVVEIAHGPNLHYEVRVDGRPVDPLADDRLAGMTEDTQDETAALLLARARDRLAELSGISPPPSANMIISTEGETL